MWTPTEAEYRATYFAWLINFAIHLQGNPLLKSDCDGTTFQNVNVIIIEKELVTFVSFQYFCTLYMI